MPSEKISVFVNNMEGGGAQRVLLNLANGIAERGYPVDLVLARAHGPYLGDVSEKIQLVDLAASRVMASVPSLISYLNSTEPTALLTGLGHVNIPAIWARRLANVKTRLVISEHNTLSQNSKKTPWRGKIQVGLDKVFYPWADAIVAVSNGAADDLAQMANIDRSSIQVIYNPVITPGLQEKSQERPEHPWFLENDIPVILAVGSLTKQKDFVTLLRSFALVRRQRVVRLVIFGEGPERSILEGLIRELNIQDDVDLPGFVDNPFSHMAHSSLYVLSSMWEGLPTVLIEALYCGAKIVSTDCPSGPREILADGKFGQLVPVRDITALAGAIQQGLDLESVTTPEESWWPYETDNVVEQYLSVLLTN